MATQAFVDVLIKEIIQPGVDKLMELPYFTELRNGKLSIKRLQGWALQHYLHNHALLKGFALCMVKNGHDPDLFKYFLYQLNEEQYHPDLAKKFGLAIGLKDADFTNATPIFECLAHTSKTIHGMLLGSASENRASALVNETMVCRYSEEHIDALRKHYGLDDKAIQFFTVHAVADQEHTQMAVDVIVKHANTERQQELVRDAALQMVRFKIAKFEGIYNSYA
ncbi:MAG: iron-containing redox enzyme family protein [Deltaproteobacteria bacterium]|nr:iron-containing redox enzyme family protein [Deltaproteobacteria bacterium]